MIIDGFKVIAASAALFSAFCLGHETAHRPGLVVLGPHSRVSTGSGKATFCSEDANIVVRGEGIKINGVMSIGGETGFRFINEQPQGE